MVPEEWEEQSLDKVFKLASGSTKPSDVVSEHRDETPHPVYGGNGVLGYSAQANHPGDVILIGRVGEYCGVTRRVTKPCWITDNALYTKDFFPENDIGFITYRLQHFDVSRLRSKGGQPLVSQKPIYLTKFALPPLPEQRKIAEILLTWDRAIEVAEAQLANARKQKRALMQSLLTGKRRFPEFEGQEWCEVRLGDIVDCLDNKRVPLNSSQRADMQGGIPYWGANGIVDYVNEYLFDEPLVLLAEDGGYFDEFATRPIASISYGKAWVNNHAHILRAGSGISTEWLFFSLVHKNILGFINSGTRSKLNKSDMLKIPMFLPSYKEQSQIAAAIGVADREASYMEQQIEKLRTEKKALMQQLLTGKRRVTI